MKKKLITIAIIICAVLALLSIDGIANALIGFTLAGVLPGTHISLPFWVMVAFWCLVITAVITIYIETTTNIIRSQKQLDSRRTRLPRRRYNQV